MVLNGADRSNGPCRFVGSAKLHASALSIAEIRVLVFFFIDLEMFGCAVSRQANLHRCGRRSHPWRPTDVRGERQRCSYRAHRGERYGR